MLTLQLRAALQAPLDCTGVVPELMQRLTIPELERYTVYYGNQAVQLADLFHLHGDCADGALHWEGSNALFHYVGAAMNSGTITVEGSVGWNAGLGMTGGVLKIHGTAGDYLGANMQGGAIEVASAGNNLGGALAGSRRGMTGGRIVVQGDVGDSVGELMRRGLIVINGQAGAFLGANLIAGTIAVAGQVGSHAGAGMKRGTLLLRKTPEQLDAGLIPTADIPLTFTQLLLRHISWEYPGNSVTCYRGDLLCGGRGELLIIQ